MKFNLYIAAIVTLALLVPVPGRTEDPAQKNTNSKAYNDLMLASEKQIDPVLKERVDAFNKNFKRKEAAYVADRDNTIEAIKNNRNFTGDEKRIKISKAQDHYQARSWNLVHTYREPINQRLLELTNKGLSSTQRVEAGMGKPPYIKKEVIVNGQKKTILVRNPKHSGALSDTDSQAGSKGIHRLAKIAEAHGIKVVIDGNTVDMPTIEHTVNRHAHDFDDSVANSSQQARLYADARNKERFLFVGIDENDVSLAGIRQAVEKNDHMKKAAGGIKLANKNPKLLLQQKNRDKFQMFGKSTNKMVSNISNVEIDAIMRKNNLTGTAESYKKGLGELHNRNWDEHGVNDKNVDAWFKTSREVQELSIKKANQLAASEKATNKADLDRLSQSLKNRNLPDEERRRLTNLYVKKKSSMIDADERLKQTRNALDEKLGKVKPTSSGFRKPAIFSDIPSRSATRKKINASADKNFKRIGKGMGYYGKINKAYSVATLVTQGNAEGLVDMAYYEFTDEISDRLKEKLVPGYGNMKLAFDVGWGTGRLIGENVRLGPGGPTVDEAAEKQMFNVYDALSGNRQLILDQERASAYRKYFIERIAEVPGSLPPGMTPSQALALVKQKTGSQGNFFVAVDTFLEAGEARLEAQHKAMSDQLMAKNEKMIDDAKMDNLVRVALDLGVSPGNLVGKNTTEVEDVIKARKTEIAASEQFDFDEESEDNSTAVDTFRNTMANLEAGTNRSIKPNKRNGINDVFDQGLADQKQYDDDLAYIERTKRETAERWKKINKKKARRAKKKAKRNQFWRDFSTAMGQAVNDYNEQQQANSAGQTSSFSSDDSDDVDAPNFDTLELGGGGGGVSSSISYTEYYFRVDGSVARLGAWVTDKKVRFYTSEVFINGRKWYASNNDKSNIEACLKLPNCSVKGPISSKARESE
ncbi:MAG: hypothetical protein COB49_11830 [Alphaproteobacteria bacterium]|nr:MAG: hypothetical protein COB49_11830 [Alphaproteobacteria bacterium]